MIIIATPYGMVNADFQTLVDIELISKSLEEIDCQRLLNIVMSNGEAETTPTELPGEFNSELSETPEVVSIPISTTTTNIITIIDLIRTIILAYSRIRNSEITTNMKKWFYNHLILIFDSKSIVLYIFILETIRRLYLQSHLTKWALHDRNISNGFCWKINQEQG